MLSSPTHLLPSGLQVFLDPCPHGREVDVDHSRQGLLIIATRLLIRVLHNLVIHLYIYTRSEYKVELQYIGRSEYKVEVHQKSLTNERERVSSTALFSPTSTNITACGEDKE